MMKVFLAGVGCVGKTAVGTCLAKRLGCCFYDLDREIEKRFGRPVGRLWAETLTPYSYRKRFASVALKELLRAESDSSFVMALLPSGLMDSMWAVLRRSDRVVIVLQDSAENILSRITFFDVDSLLVMKQLTEKERATYLRGIRADMAYFARSFRRADLTVDIAGLGVEASAVKIEQLLRERWKAAAAP
jgi:shikimate kinase